MHGCFIYRCLVYTAVVYCTTVLWFCTVLYYNPVLCRSVTLSIITDVSMCAYCMCVCEHVVHVCVRVLYVCLCALMLSQHRHSSKQTSVFCEQRPTPDTKHRPAKG